MAKKVLIVDDSPIVLEMLRILLESAGYSVQTHSESFGFIVTIAATLPDVIVMDLEMPKMDGVEVVERLRGFLGKDMPPVLFHSDRSERELRDAAMRAKAEGYVRKGNSVAFMTALRQVMR